MQLDGEQIGEFKESLLNTFDIDSFKTMLLEKLNRELSNFTTENKDFPTTLVEVIKKANKEGWVEELILRAKEVRPKNEKLSAFAQKIRLIPKNSDLPQNKVITTNDLITKEAFDLKELIDRCRNIFLLSPKVHTFILGYNKDSFSTVFFNRLKRDCAIFREEIITKKVDTINFTSPVNVTFERIKKHKHLLQTQHLCLFVRFEKPNDEQEILGFIDSVTQEFNSHSDKTLLVIICSEHLFQINSSKNITVLPSLTFSGNDLINWINEIVIHLNWESIIRQWIKEAFQECCLNETNDPLDPSLIYDYIENIIEIFTTYKPQCAKEFWAIKTNSR